MKSIFGIFDSGLGGLSVLSRVLERHGELDIVYLGDTARVPYGEKSPSEINQIALEVVSWLMRQNVTHLLVACNTTNSLALDVVKRVANVPIFDLISSTTSMITEQRIGVLATPATVASRAYSNFILAERPQTFVLEQSCPEFVPLIESGQFYGPRIKQLAKDYLDPLIRADVQAVILGCSHYPFLAPLLSELLPSHVRLVDPAIGLAFQLDKVLGPPGSLHRFSKLLASTGIYVTDDPFGFAEAATQLLGIRPEVQLINLRS